MRSAARLILPSKTNATPSSRPARKDLRRSVTQHAAGWSDWKTANRAESRDESVCQSRAEVVWTSLRLVDVHQLHRQHSQ